jgi:hypothetical protein
MKGSLLQGNKKWALLVCGLLLAGAVSTYAQMNGGQHSTPTTTKATPKPKHRKTKHHSTHHAVTHQSNNDKDLQQIKNEKNKEKGLK